MNIMQHDTYEVFMNLPTITRFWLAGCAFLLTACSSSAPLNFERMSLSELVTYNRTVEPMDQIYCTEEFRVGSHIRRRRCETLIEIQERVANSASAINVIGTGPIF